MSSKRKNKPKYNMFQNSWYMIKLAWHAKEKKVLFLCLSLVIIQVLINVINLFISPLVISGIENHVEIFRLLMSLLIFVSSLIILNALKEYVDCNTLYGRVTVRTEIIKLINRKAATTSYPNLFDKKFLELLDNSGNFCSSNDEATEAIWDTLTNLFTVIICFIIYLFLLTFVHPLFVIFIIISSLITYFVGNYVNEYGYRHKEEQGVIVQKLNYLNKFSTNVQFAKEVKIFGLRSWILDLYDKSVKAFTLFHKKAESVYIIASLVDLIMSFLRNAIAYYFLIRQVVYNNLSISEFILYFSVVTEFSTWINSILGGFNRLNKQSLDINIIRECLEYKEVFAINEGKRLKASDFDQFSITLENVSFKYPNSDNYILKDINLTLNNSEKLAVVGLNGAGKTTLIKLMCGFLNPSEGRVLLNGVDIKEYNRTDYYTLFSAVFQDFIVLPGSIATNIAQTDENIDYKKIEDTLIKADLMDKVKSLKEGYNTLLNRSVYENAILLSGGETQKLMLARALYKDAPFVVLDEPTSALDPIAEAEMYQKYNELTTHKSSIYISHRLASTRFCDRIIVIQDCKIVEEGTHEYLIENGTIYKDLFNIQSKYYKEGEVKDEE